MVKLDSYSTIVGFRRGGIYMNKNKKDTNGS